MNCYIIDDEQYCIDYLSDCIDRTDSLRVAGYDTDPLRALYEMGALSDIDLVFIDIDLPHISGFEVIKRLPPHMKVVVTTANPLYRAAAERLGVAGFIPKPFSLSVFQSVMRNITEQSRYSLP